MSSEERNAINRLDRLARDETHDEINFMESRNKKEKKEHDNSYSRMRELRKEETRPAVAYTEGNELLIENAQGDVISEAAYNEPLPKKNEGNKSRRSSLSNLKKIFLPNHDDRPNGGRHRPSKYYAYKMDNQLIIEDDEGEVLRRYKITTHGNKKDGDHGSILQKALAILGIKSNSRSRTATPTSTPSAALPKDSHRGVHGEENRKISDDDEEEPETTVEKERRLSALGYLSAPRDKDDEEAPPRSLEHDARKVGEGAGPARKTRNSLEKKLHLK